MAKLLAAMFDVTCDVKRPLFVFLAFLDGAGSRMGTFDKFKNNRTFLLLFSEFHFEPQLITITSMSTDGLIRRAHTITF